MALTATNWKITQRTNKELQSKVQILYFEYKQQYQFESIYCQLPWILSSN